MRACPRSDVKEPKRGMRMMDYSTTQFVTVRRKSAKTGIDLFTSARLCDYGRPDHELGQRRRSVLLSDELRSR